MRGKEKSIFVYKTHCKNVNDCLSEKNVAQHFISDKTHIFSGFVDRPKKSYTQDWDRTHDPCLQVICSTNCAIYADTSASGTS